MWKIVPESEFRKKQEGFKKKHHRELQAVLDNLDTVHKALCEGAKVQHVKMGCIHPEPRGVLAIDQKGGGAKLKATRLYIYPDEDEKIIYLITLGDKASQKNDIKYCREWVDDHLKQKESGKESV